MANNSKLMRRLTRCLEAADYYRHAECAYHFTSQVPEHVHDTKAISTSLRLLINIKIITIKKLRLVKIPHNSHVRRSLPNLLLNVTTVNQPPTSIRSSH